MTSYTNLFKTVPICCLLLYFMGLSGQKSDPYLYVHPKPSSVMVSDESNIILRHSDNIDRSALSSGQMVVVGSKSGVHSGRLVLTDDDKTLVFNPDTPFEGDENVSVSVVKGIRTETGADVPEFHFDFKTAPEGIEQLPHPAFDEASTAAGIREPLSYEDYPANNNLPAPTITIDSINDPSPGYIFMATWDRNVPALYGNFIFILDKNGAILDSVRVNGAPFDFQVQPNGLLSYALGDFAINVPGPGEELQHMVLDGELTVVDSFKMKNGYTTDFHEFKMLPNGHVMMMSYHTITYDLSTIVEGGKPDASLVINVIQEQDRDKNVVFEWRNIDYIPITDSDEDLTASRINYGTLNAFDVDDDGNILASFRNHSEIMKISRQTGEVLWRMGGPRGEFSYVGEHEENAPYYHARQHNIRRRPNGNITLFDNGQFHKPPYSRAVEYELDEENMVATLASEWRYPNGNIFCVTAGNAETLPNGGWFIGYGVPNAQFVERNVVEVHPDGSIALELSLPRGILAYRAYKLPWKETVNIPSYTHYEVKEGNTYSFNDSSIITGVEITYGSLSSPDYNESTITRSPYGPVNPEFIENSITISPVSILYKGFAITGQSAEFHIDLAVYPEIRDPENTKIYYREFPGQGLFIAVSTTFDSTLNELVGTLSGFGEIVFGVPESDARSNVPILYEPMDQKKLVLQDPLTLRWTGKGSYNSFNVQVATDTAFTNILQESNTNLSDYPVTGLSNNSTYYWRVNSVLGDQSSQWSQVWSFEITDPYISAVTPGGGEIWNRGDTEIIRWETNILEKVHISLLQDQNVLLSIDTVQGSHQAYAWNMPGDLPTGENYRIRITSESNPGIFGLSEGVFTIQDTATNAVAEDQPVILGYDLEQNYPNPFNSTTRISYSIHQPNHVILKVYDLFGKEVETLVSEFREVGSYSAIFDAGKYPSGIYFYKLEAGNDSVGLRKMLLIR